MTSFFNDYFSSSSKAKNDTTNNNDLDDLSSVESSTAATDYLRENQRDGHSKKKRNKNPVTSLKVFRSFLLRRHDGSIDASAITSTACFEAWLRARKGSCKRPERFFQRTLTSHLTGTDGRTPFEPDEEKAILAWLRIRQRWPCFEKSSVRFGEQGFRGKGFYERNAEISSPSTSSKAELEDADTDDADTESSAERGNRKRSTKRQRTGEEKDSEEESTTTATPPPVLPFGESQYVQEIQKGMQATIWSEPHAVIWSATLSLLNMFSTLADVNRQWFTFLLGYMRMRILSRGFLPPTMEDAREALKNTEEAYPGHFVFIFDFTCKNNEDRIMLQNEESIKLWGRISRADGGYKGRRFLPEDFWFCIKCVMRAFHDGTETIGRVRWILKDGSVAWFISYFRMDSAKGLCIEHGYMLESVPGLTNQIIA